MQFFTSTVLGVAAEGEAAASTGESMPLLPHTSELIFGLVVFAILFFFVNKYVVPGLEKAYAERAAAIEGGMQQAEKAQAEAEATKAQYEAQLQDAKTEAARIRQEAREQGAGIVAEMRAQAQAEATRIVEGGNAQLEAQRNQTVRQLHGELGRLSTDLASKIVGESLESEVRQKGLVERFLADLESGAVKPQASGRSLDGADR